MTPAFSSASAEATIASADFTSSAGNPNTSAASDNDTFLKESLSGGSVTCYDQQGNELNVQLRWARTAANTWNCYYQSDS